LQIAHPRSIFPEILRVPFLKLRVWYEILRLQVAMLRIYNIFFP
jgi:hypothetical protein